MTPFEQTIAELAALTEHGADPHPGMWDGIAAHLLSDNHIDCAAGSVEGMMWAKRYPPFVVVFVCHLLIAGVEKASTEFVYFNELEAAVRRLAEASAEAMPTRPPP